MTSPQPNHSKPGHRGGGIFIIAICKLIQGVLLLVVSLGVLHSLHRGVRHDIEQVINLVRIDPENRYVAALLGKMGLVDDRHLKELGGLAAIYAGLFLTEGTGLLFRKRWAEYLTVIATGSFIPLEIYEIARHCTAARIVLLVGNLVIFVYLIVVLKRKPEV
jgi:uncharacterized membrane protein (DUF2068 family)